MAQVTPADRQALLNLILDVSFERKEVTLASGKKSNFYLDLRQTLMRPKGVSLSGRLVLDLLQSGPPVEAVGGMAVGAVPLVASVLAAAAADPATDSMLGFFVRKEKKAYGMGKQLEGGFAAGQNVALVEDTTTTGGSTIDAMDIVEAAGGKVARVICLVDRGEGAAEAFAERGVQLESIFGRQDLPI
ncbi:MAG: orotate phosphoribosyltransferase [Myxococcota bacterium]